MTSETQTAATPDRPPTTRLWVALQKLSRLRDEYTRGRTAEGRTAAAAAMIGLADEVKALTTELFETAGRVATEPAAT